MSRKFLIIPASLAFIASIASVASSEILLRGAIHVHSLRSFDSKGTFAEIENAARKTGLDFIILTDHVATKKSGINAPMPVNTAGLTWIEGVEVLFDKKKQDLLVIGSGTFSLPWRQDNALELVKEAKSKGALVILEHFTKHGVKTDAALIDAVSLYNTHEDTLHPAWKMPAVFFKGVTHRRQRRSAWLSLLDEPKHQVRLWQIPGLAHLAIVAGVDAHQNVRMFGRQLDPYEDLFNLVSTYVWSRDRSEGAILEAIKAGRTYIAFTILGEAKGFSFNRSKDGLAITLPEASAARIRLIHNGKLVEEKERNTWTWSEPKPGLWRAEVWKEEKGKWRPWIYSNAIEVK